MFLLSFTKEASVSHHITCCRLVEKHSAGLQLILEALFTVCREGSNLITGATTFLVAGLVWTEGPFSFTS